MVDVNIHNGGEFPGDDEKLIRVKFRDGREWFDVRAKYLCWDHAGLNSDVMEWQYVE